MFLGILLLTTPTIYAQDYLAKVKEFLDQGDCERARFAYEDYKKYVNPQGNAEVKRRIDECKQGVPPAATPTPANQEFTVNGIAFNMVYVEGGTFTMGCTGEQGSDCMDGEKPAHKVTLSSFYMGETEVTQGLWRAVMGDEPYSGAWTDKYGRGISYPAYKVSWYDCQKFIWDLNALLRYRLPAGWHFALPTEAQWEFAARGGNQSRGYMYSGSNTLEDVVWLYDNSKARGGRLPDYRYHPVKKKQPNELGLYDMTGNVAEIVVMPNGEIRALGGHYASDETELTDKQKGISADKADPRIGFRLVCTTQRTMNSIR